MKILLVDVDSKMPNLALRKLWAWHEGRGDEVRYLRGSLVGLYAHVRFDKVYISCIFSKNAEKAREIAELFPNAEVGGYGVNGAKLPDEIEHTMPNYHGMDSSMGYTKRGCNRNCPWCVIPQREGPTHEHAPITEFHHPSHDKLILLDPNFLDGGRWRENLQYIIDNGLKVNFTQGLDIRLVNEENAKMLAECKFYNWKFTYRQLHFAFDTPEIEPEVRRGIGILEDAGVKPRKMMFYELVGFNTGFGQDLHRFEVLRELGVDPFVMIYNDRRDIPILRHFARWVNKRVYKVCWWGDYDHGDSQAVIKAAILGGRHSE